MKEVEIWKSLDFMGYTDYEVSNFGRVKSLNYRHTGKERILKPRKNRGGYLQLHLAYNGKRKTFVVHRLVALAFLENPNNLPQINHKDENKENNKVDNLEFCSARYNMNYGTRIERVSKNISLSLKGKMSGKNNPMYGKHHTEETKQKLRKPKTEEHKQKLSKPILQFTLEGIFVREWDSITQAEQELNLSHISDCCKGKRNKCGGYIWKYKE